MRTTTALFVLVGIVATPLAAQDRGGRWSDRGPGIPPGQLPPPGECRVWYDGRPPGRQPAPTSCRDAERIAARDRNARVIYGGPRDARRDGWWANEPWRGGGRAVPRKGGYVYTNVPFKNGYADGYDKGREDARDRDRYDPIRHGRYRSGDRGYDRRYGSRNDYRDIYRDGFRAGYDDAYREHARYGYSPF